LLGGHVMLTIIDNVHIFLFHYIKNTLLTVEAGSLLLVTLPLVRFQDPSRLDYSIQMVMKCHRH